MLHNGKGYANAVRGSPYNSSTLESELLAVGETPGHAAPGQYPSSLSLTSDDTTIPDRQVPSEDSSPKYGGMPTAVDALCPKSSSTKLPATSEDEAAELAAVTVEDHDGFRVVTSRLRSTSVSSTESRNSRISGPRVFSVAFGETVENIDERVHPELEPVMVAAERRLTKDEKDRISRREKALVRKRKEHEAKEKIASKERKTRRSEISDSDNEDNTRTAGPSYFEKGKFRAEDVRGTEADQVYRDYEIARELQNAELVATRDRAVKLKPSRTLKNKPTAEENKSRSKEVQTSKDPKRKGREGLKLTQFIQSPSPIMASESPEQNVQPNRLPLKSPKRAINQIPQGGYLWSAIGNETPKKTSKNGKKKSRLSSKQLNSRMDEASLSSSDRDSPPSSSDSTSSSEPSSPSKSSTPDSSSTSDPSSSSTENDDSGSTSSSSDDSGKRKRKRRSTNRRKRSKKSQSMKFPEPSTYNGRENLADFEKFVFETKNYFGASKMSGYWQIRALGKYLTDKAGQHYMAFAAVDPDRYTIDTYLRELFNHCFPPHFRQKMREKFNRCVQGTRGTREYLRELRTLGNRLPDIGETQIRHRFWEGSTSYIRLEWARAGLDPETSSLSQLEIAAERFESAERLRKLEEGKGGDSRNGNRKREPSEDRGRHDRRRRNHREVRRRKRSRDFSRRHRDQTDGPKQGNATKSEEKPKYNQKRNGKYQEKRKNRRDELTQDEMDELRAANKCFTCKNVGHMSKDCPQRNTAKRPGLSTVTFVDLEKLAEAERESQTLTLGSMGWQDLTAESLALRVPLVSEILVQDEIDSFMEKIRIRLDSLLPLPGDKYADESSDSRWIIQLARRPLAPEFIITDTQMGWERYHVPIEFIKYDVDFAEDFIETRWQAFVNATINDDVVNQNIIRRFEEALNSPESGLLNDDTLKYGSQQYWVRKELEPIGGKEFVIEDMFPESGYRGIDDIYRISRSEILSDEFNIANFIHEEKWVRQRILNAISGTTYPSDNWSASDPSIDPDKVERWMIQTLSTTAYHILDRRTEKIHLLRRSLAHDTSVDIGEWMATQQRMTHGEAWDGADLSSDEEEFWTAAESEADDRVQELDDQRGWRISPTWDIPEGMIPHNDFDPPSESEERSEGMAGSVRWVMETDESDGPPDLARVSGSSDIEDDLEDNVSEWSDQDCPVEAPQTADLPMEFDRAGSRRASPTSLASEDGLEALGDLHLGAVAVENGTQKGRERRLGPAKQASRSGQRDYQGSAPQTTLSAHSGAASNRSEKKSQKRKVLDRLERNSARTKDFTRLVPSALVVEVRINGQIARALVDSGSLADFMSTKLADQLKLATENLEKPMAVQLAVTGSRTVVNSSVTVEFELQGVREQRRFDIINLESYDIILGTPFLFQHKVGMAFNPSKIAIGSNKSLPLEGEQIAAIPSRAADVLQGELDKIRKSLRDEARDLCKGVGETSLPPLRAVNHEIPLIDPSKVYGWRPSKCPEAMRPLWNEKRDQYLKSGRWRFRTGNNASPMLILWKPKPGPDGKRRIRTVVDKREQNSNTKKMASPLPDMEAMLRNASKHKYRSLMDGKDAYEQIRVLPEHVPRTLFNTPDGTMESLVLQQGDCNGGATYQSLMNHIFASYIGVFMDVYLDDILVYSDTIEEHIKHIRKVFEVLRREKLFLSPDKMDFFARELKILGHVVTDSGIRMDPHKVDTILNWKTPTSKELLSGFLGSVGYLANGIANVRVPMAVLTPLTGSERSFRWGATEQRAFEQVKSLVHEHRNKHRVSIDYSEKAPWINLTCDASLTGAGGHLSQGDDLETAKNVAFWSGKFNAAQQNYPTHERELLAIIESLKRFKHLLLGAKFRIFSDHRSLENLSRQKNLSPRQARWLEFLCEFDYEIHYLPGSQNRLSDALSRMYSEEPEGVRRAQSEFVAEDEEPPTPTRISVANIYQPTEPLYTGLMALPELNLSTATPPEQVPLRRSNRIRIPTKRDDHDYDRLYLTKQPAKAKRTVQVTVEEVPDEGNAPPSGSTPDTERPPRNEAPEAAPPPITNEAGDQHLVGDESRDCDETIDPENRNNGSTEIKPPKPKDLQVNQDVPEPLAAIASSGEGIDIYGGITGRYSQDPLFKDVIADPSRYRNFESRDGFLYLKDGGKSLLCIPDVKLGGRRIREILITYAHSLLAHLGSRKTVHYLRDHVWWKGLVADVEAYCESCNVCSLTKSRTTKPFGVLKTIEVPSRPWQVISIDFVGPLPLSKNRHGAFDMITVVIDHLTSMVHLAPSAQTYKAKEIAELVFDVIYRHHGLPEIIISDRDSYFTSGFYKELHQLIGVELRLSTAYHPQTDGATERANRTMTQMLRQCVAPNQKDWVLRLPGIEFAMNCARSDTTGFSPFFLNYGRVPDPMVWDKSSDYPGVRVFAQRIKDAILSAHDSIIAARVKQTKEANKHRRPAPFAKGDLVYLSTENLALPKKRARKLVPKFIGPYRILEEVSKGASYKLELPRELKQRGVHPVFHASLLRVHVPNDDRRFPGRNIRQLSAFEESPAEWDVEKIVTHYGKGDDVLFKLRWKSGDETWTDLRTASKLEQLQQYFDLLGVSSSAELPNKIDETPENFEIHLSSAGIEANPSIKGRDKPMEWAIDPFVLHNSSSLSPRPIMQGQNQQPPVNFIETKRGRYNTALIDRYKEYEYLDLCNKIWYRTGHHERIQELGPPPQDFSWWSSDPESQSITPYFTAVALNVPDHVISKFLKSTQDLEDAQAKVKIFSGGKQPMRRTRGGNSRHNPMGKPASFQDNANSGSETPPSDPSSPAPALDLATIQSVAFQTFQNAFAPQLQQVAAMMGQLTGPNQAGIAHTGATPHMNSLQVTVQPQPVIAGTAQGQTDDELAPLSDILGPNPFGEDANMGGQAQD